MEEGEKICILNFLFFTELVYKEEQLFSFFR